MKATRVTVLVAALTMSACGSGGDESGGLGAEVFDGVGQASGDVESTQPEAASAAEVGPVTQTADPSTGWVEVEGERYEFEAFGSTHFSCDILDDRITINFQETTSGHDLTIQGSVFDGSWNANMTFAPDVEGSQVSYGANIGLGTLGLEENALSFEGTTSKVVDFDLANAQEAPAVVAINCAAPGGVPTAEVAGESLEFPLSGASNLDCVVSDEGVDILISRNLPDRIQMQIDIDDNDGELFGAVHVSFDDATYTSFVPADGSGLTIDGQSVTYQGQFTTPTGEEVEGSVAANCG